MPTLERVVNDSFVLGKEFADLVSMRLLAITFFFYSSNITKIPCSIFSKIFLDLIEIRFFPLKA